MLRLKKERSKKGRKNSVMLMILRKDEMNFIRGRDQGNTEKDGDQ